MFYYNQNKTNNIMVTELLILFPLFIGYKVKLLNIPACIAIILFCYWIPKSVFIRALEKFYPNVKTRNLLKCNQTKLISLTFDDVPYDNVSFQKILALLDIHQQKGTFFVISDYIKEYNIQMLIKAVQNGHHLANHGKTNSMHYLKNKTDLEAEVKVCDDKIDYIYHRAGVQLPKIKYYRPGCGLFGKQMLDVVKELNHELALGSVYPNDPMVPISIVNYYYLINHIEGGDIVILHDRNWTPGMLEKLLPWMKANNYQSVTLEQLIN